ncbi:MAG: murein hydrolase activator EnvC family protein [Acidiferrobacterales bacterium]
MPESSITQGNLRFPQCRGSFVLGLARQLAVWVVLASGIGFVPAADAVAQNASSNERAAELQQLRARIRQLQKVLNDTVTRRDLEREELRQLESTIGTLVRTARMTNSRLREHSTALRTLRHKRAAAHTDLERQKQGLEHGIQAAYVMGQQEYLKMLLSQEDPATVSRMLAYYGYLSRARGQQIADARAMLARLLKIEQEIEQRTRELEALRAAQLEQKQALEVTRIRREQVLASLNQEVHDQSEEITRLRDDERRLQRLLEQLQNYLAGLPSEVVGDAHFGDLKGKLPFPTNGRLLARFGESRNRGDLRWKGVLVGGPEGQDVISVARGRVAFADWLRGFGLLLILEHGDGYMTLYGHNQSLYAQVGDWVEAGQIIASLGSTGDAPRPGVYFEIRQQGQPRNPLQWLRRP